MMIPLRADLSECVALAPMAPEALQPAPEQEEARQAVIRERSLWMARDLYQAGATRAMCERNAELVDLIRRNNEAAQQ